MGLKTNEMLKFDLLQWLCLPYVHRCSSQIIARWIFPIPRFLMKSIWSISFSLCCCFCFCLNWLTRDENLDLARMKYSLFIFVQKHLRDERSHSINISFSDIRDQWFPIQWFDQWTRGGDIFSSRRDRSYAVGETTGTNIIPFLWRFFRRSIIADTRHSFVIDTERERRNLL